MAAAGPNAAAGTIEALGEKIADLKAELKELEKLYAQAEKDPAGAAKVMPKIEKGLKDLDKAAGAAAAAGATAAKAVKAAG